MKNVIRAVIVCCLLLTPVLTNAYTPEGWTYFYGPYAYDVPIQIWVYFNESDTQWCLNLSGGNWSVLSRSPLSAGWVYWQWPYAFHWDSGAWFYLNEGDTQWCLNLSSHAWSRLGTQVNAAFAGSYRLSATLTAGGTTVSIIGVVAVGSDASRQGSDGYIFIPASGNSQTYSGVDSDNDPFTTSVTVSGRTITEHTDGQWAGGGGGWTSDETLQFAPDFQSGHFTGRYTDTEDGPSFGEGTFVRL